MSASNEVLTFLPEMSAVAGYVAGYGAEVLARHSIEANRTAAVGAHENVSLESHRRDLLGKWAGRLSATLALVGATAGFAIGQALRPHDASLVEKPTLVEAVDHNFRLGSFGDNSVGQINKIAEGVAASKSLKLHVYIGQGDSDLLKNVNQLNQEPYGPVAVAGTVDKAIGSAYSNSVPVSSNGLGEGNKRNAGVFVVTDDNSAGQVNGVVEKAKQNGNIPIFIANVGSDKDQTAQDLKDIAKQTGGQYWHATGNPQQISSAIRQEVVPRPIAIKKNSSDRIAWLAEGLALVGIAALRFRRRSQNIDKEPVVS